MPDIVSMTMRAYDAPSPEAVDAIRSAVASTKDGWQKSDADIAAALNAPTIVNTTPRSATKKPYTLITIMGAMADASVGRLIMSPIMVELIDAMRDRDGGAVDDCIEAMQRGGIVTAEERAAIDAIVSATEPDPAWVEKTSWARSVLGRSVSADDVARARVK